MFKVFSQYFPLKVVFLIITESFLISGALLASIHLRFYNDSFMVDEVIQGPLFLFAASVIVVLCQFCLYYNDLYDLTTVCRRSELLIRLVQAIGGWCLLLAAGYFFFPDVPLGRGILLITVFLVMAVVWLWREGVGRLGFLFKNRERVLMLGTGPVGIALCRKILARNDLNFEIVGFLDEDPRRIGERIVNPGVIGTFDNLESVVASERINRVVVSLPDRRGRLPVRDLLRLRLRGVIIEDAHTLYENVAGRISLDTIRPSWLIFSDGFQKFRWQLFLKRCFDLLFASVGLLLTLPAMAVVAICIKLDSEGPVLFQQERVGQFGSTFTLLKFRSMKAEAESDGVPRWAVENDLRITRMGRFLRLTRLDELPQFFNILRGEMSFVGPRPERPYFVDVLEEKLKYYRERHVVKPGLTGWAQIKFRYGSSEEDAREKLEYDFFYIKNASVVFDLAIIFETVKTVLFGQGAR